MEDTRTSNTTTSSDNCESLAPNAANDPSSKMQKTSTISTPNPPNDNNEVSAAAAFRKQKNEDSCPIYKLVSNDEIKLIFGHVGEKKDRFVACTSYRFHQIYLDTFGGEAFTSIESVVASVSCAAVCLDSEEPGCKSRARSLFKRAAKEGKLEILIWGEDSGYELDTMLDCNIIAQAALHGHLEVVKYLRQLGVSWNERTCRNAAKKGHLELLKWARANQCPWDEGKCSAAAATNGHLVLLKWARVNQCPWDEWTCSHTALNGHLELLKWAEQINAHGMNIHASLLLRMATLSC